jgi:hypothetical protein
MNSILAKPTQITSGGNNFIDLGEKPLKAMVTPIAVFRLKNSDLSTGNPTSSDRKR